MRSDGIDIPLLMDLLRSGRAWGRRHPHPDGLLASSREVRRALTKVVDRHRVPAKRAKARRSPSGARVASASP